METITIKKALVDGKDRHIKRGQLVLNDLGPSWGIELESGADAGFETYSSGADITVEIETGRGVLTGPAKVLRATKLSASVWKLEAFAMGPLMLGEEVFRAG